MRNVRLQKTKEELDKKAELGLMFNNKKCEVMSTLQSNNNTMLDQAQIEIAKEF